MPSVFILIFFLIFFLISDLECTSLSVFCPQALSVRSTSVCYVLVPSICLIDKLYKEIISQHIPTRVAVIGEITPTIGLVTEQV